MTISKYILVTGANKGIGLATVQEVLLQDVTAHVFLGSRDLERGRAAKQHLVSTDPSAEQRVTVLPLDVTNVESVTQAATTVTKALNGQPLYGIVNNAGIWEPSLQTVLDVNVYGIHNVCSAFLPLLSHNGRIVNVSSAAGPSFVSTCSPERQKFLTDHSIEWSEIESFMMECLSLGSSANFARSGLGSGSPYHLSKACANAYTLYLAHAHPKIRSNACTPGFIETDLTRPMAASSGRSPQEMGMKSPREGTVSILFLLLGEPEGNGHYYGSDALRSPLDKYRSPGDPPYTGD